MEPVFVSDCGQREGEGRLIGEGALVENELRLNTVKPPNSGHFGDSSAVRC